MFFRLIAKELSIVFRGITVYILFAAIGMFYFSQYASEVNPAEIMASEGLLKSEISHTVDVTGPDEEMIILAKQILSDIERKKIMRMGFLNSYADLTQEKHIALILALKELTGGWDGQGTPKIIVSYERYLEIVRNLDKKLGGGTHYGDNNRRLILQRPMTDAEKDENYNIVIAEDKISGIFARLFADYMGITAGIFPIFICAFVLIKDKRSRMRELIYMRNISSAARVSASLLAAFTALIICYLPYLAHAGISFSIAAIKGGFSIDHLAFLKYFLGWIVPTLFFVTCLGVFISILFDNAIPAILVQFALSFFSIYPLQGSYGLGKAVIRYNSLDNNQVFSSYRSAIAANRIFFIVISIVLAAGAIVIWDRRRTNYRA